MNVAEAQKALSGGLRFGDPEQIKALPVLAEVQDCFEALLPYCYCDPYEKCTCIRELGLHEKYAEDVQREAMAMLDKRLGRKFRQ